MISNVKVRIENTVLAWELYVSRQYEKTITEFKSDQSVDVQDIITLASIELRGSEQPQKIGHGNFALLVEGMLAYNSSDFSKATIILGSWLLKKDFFSELTIQRFLDAAKKTDNYLVSYSVSKKLLKNGYHKENIIGAIIKAAYCLNKYKEVIALFNAYREYYNDDEILQNVAFSLTRLGRYREAERLLLHLYKNVKGTDYELDYESVKAQYKPLINVIPELEKNKSLSHDELVNLGMAYLFNLQYEKAIKTFKSLINSR